MKILIHGYGRVGKLVAAAIGADDLVQIIDINVKSEAEINGNRVNEGEMSARIEDYGVKFDRPDVIVDFSNHLAIVGLIEYATREGIPLVIGTTGFDQAERNLIVSAAKIIPICLDGNYSRGFWLFEQAVCKVTKGFGRPQIIITETHHIHKSDSPSGSALRLAEAIRSQLGGSDHILNDCNGKELDVSIRSIREGEVIGKHQVDVIGDSEGVSLTHEVKDRRVFALGAVAVARRLIAKPAGLYCAGDFWSED